MKVLIVEDDESIRYVLEMIVCDFFKHECYKAATLETAKHTLLESKPDVILLDWLMEGSDSRAVIDLARERLTPAPHIIILSAAKESKEIADTLQVAWLGKPFDLKDLERMLTECSAQC